MAVRGKAANEDRRPAGGGWPALWSLGLAVRRLMLRTGQGSLRPLWRLAYEGYLWTLAGLLRRGTDASVYVGGTFGTGEPVYGLSDVDVVVVVPSTAAGDGRARLRLRRRWEEIRRRFPPLAWVLAELHVYEERELEDVTSATCLTYGLARPASHPAVFLGRSRPADEAGLLVRPGPWVTREWRLVAGPERRPPAAARSGPDLAATWLELQLWWRLAYAAVHHEEGAHTTYLCAKLVADPARLVLWLEHGERVPRRADVLDRAGELVPEEEDAFRRARELLAALPRTARPPLDELLPPFVRLSSRVVTTVTARAFDGGETYVRLVGAGTAPLLPPGLLDGLPAATRPLPLADWRARAAPVPGDEAFAVVAGDPSRRDDLAAAVAAYRPRAYAALAAGGLLAFAGHGQGAVRLRSVQCSATDPVSFALAADEERARFPEAPGWSARDSARRAVAEHRAWLAGLPDGAPPETTLAMLLSAARAAIFLESLEEGEPELAVTLAASAEQLAARRPSARAAADDALAAYAGAATGGAPPPARTCRALLDVVRQLPAYAPR